MQIASGTVSLVDANKLELQQESSNFDK